MTAAGFDPGETDGIYGPHTAAAVQDFQRASQLDADGVVGESTWRALAADPSGMPLRQRRFTEQLHGATGGDDVLAVQRTLVGAGFDPGETDGIYGPRTAAAVRGFQRARGLDVDGVVGPATRTALGELTHHDDFRLVTTTSPPGRPAPLALALANEGAVAVLEIEPGVLAGIDLATGERVGGPFRAEPPAPFADVEVKSGDVGPPRPVDAPDATVRPTAATVTSMPDGPVVASAWSDGVVRCWSLLSGRPVGEPQVADLEVDAPLTAAYIGGTIYVVGQGKQGEVYVIRQWPDTSTWSLYGGEGVAEPVVYALGGRPAIAVISRDITPHGAGQVVRRARRRADG